MCGLVGAIAFGKLNKKDEKVRQRLMRYLSTELLLETEERGGDATGSAVLFTDGNFTGIKRGDQSSKWLSKFGKGKTHYGSLLEIWRKHTHPAKVFIGHCRKGTVGDKEDNENNHPIKIRNIVGVHNGVIRNADEIQKQLGCKRDGEVDSEMIFRLMHHFTNSGTEPFTMDIIEQIISRLTGAFAVMSFNADNLSQMPIFRDGRPLEMILIKDLSLLIIVSESKFWSRVHFRYERMVAYGEVNLPSLLDMKIEKEMLSDDTAVIFDLTKKCTADTSIDDLGEYKKIPRNNKIWTTTAALSVSNRSGVYNYTSGQKMAETEKDKIESKKKIEEKEKEEAAKKLKDKVNKDTKSADKKTDKSDSEDEDGTKKRVFNNISRKYELVTVSNPTKLGHDKSVVIPVDATNDEHEESKDIKVTFEKDIPGQETTNDKLEIEDSTMYTESEKDVIGSEDENIIDIDNKDLEVKEVDMSVEDPEAVGQANKQYDNDVNKGYADIETLLNDINVRSENTANEIGIKVIANRVARVQWIKGFILGWSFREKKISESDTSDVKKELREKHIVGLKSMAIILAQFFSRTKSEGRKQAKKSDKALTALALNHIEKNSGLDMDKLSSVFNSYEADKIKEVHNVLTTAMKASNKGE